MEESQDPLKVLYLITKSNVGGAQRYVYDLATHAAKNGHDVVVGFGGNGLLKDKLSEKGIRTHTIEALGRDVSPLSDARVALSLIQLIAKEEPDVLHLNSSKIGGLGGFAGRVVNGKIHITNLFKKRRAPIHIVFTGHGWAFTEARPDWQRALIALTHWVTIQLAHTTIAVSERTRDEVARIPLTSHKMKIIHNGIANIVTLEKANALTQMIGKKSLGKLPPETLIIGTIGELHANKGHMYALEALAQMKKLNKSMFRFIIIGEGEERARLEAAARSLDLEQEVIFHTNANASQMLSGFDVFLFPSIKEGFPYAILEAGNVGLPVIATAVGGIPEVIDDMKSGILIQAKNSGEISRALLYLMNEADRRREFSKAIKERVEGKFSLDHMAEETFSLYRKGPTTK